MKLYLNSVEDDDKVIMFNYTLDGDDIEDFAEALLDVASPMKPVTWSTIVEQEKIPEGDCKLTTQQCNEYENMRRVIVDGERDIVVKMITRIWGKMCTELGKTIDMPPIPNG